ncbi:Aste57867_22502 [Aphanomyces stellatus]|uniref:Aste57867_22502 protein n=1 Tax=Aphanomyces stellatus TaxID=120398 RepID=A0A485LLX7_9STRA|nr:hypothetical protein As57867_022432 [Aphanomyces stellatus]VFT99162.1 Aste57867_22502 [Aphanomyces stellatus]
MQCVLREASEAQQHAADTLTHAEWGAPELTLEQYLERENELYATEFADEAMTAYVLVPKDDPDTLDFLSYVEAFKRPCLYGDARVSGYGIDAVYTPPKHRKKGYASIMLQQLVEVFHATSSVVISNLYSDIGASFYAKKGWTPHSATQLVIPTTFPSAAPTAALTHVDSPAAVAAICDHDVQLMAAQMTSSAVYFVLTPAVITWFQVRSHYYGRKTAGLSVVPTSLGIVDKTQYMLWTHDFVHRRLVLLRCHVNQDRFPAFLHAALDEAKKWGLTDGVELWSPAPWMADVYAPFLETREDNLPSLMVSHRPAKTNESVVWLANEKYAWV